MKKILHPILLITSFVLLTITILFVNLSSAKAEVFFIPAASQIDILYDDAHHHTHITNRETLLRSDLFTATPTSTPTDVQPQDAIEIAESIIWERSSNPISASSRNDEIAIASGLDLETFPDNVWDRSFDGRSYAYWARINSVDIHKFKTSFNMPNDFNPTQYQAMLRSSSFLSDIIPINDNIYVFVNGEEIYRGGSSYGASIDIELIPETDGWHVNGVTVNNLQSGENIIEIITEEWGGTWGGLGELELQLIESPITPTPTPTNTPTPTSTPTNTSTPTSTPANTSTPTSTPTNTPTPTSTPANTPTPTSTPANTPTPTSTPANTPTPTSTPANTPTLTLTPTSTPTDVQPNDAIEIAESIIWERSSDPISASSRNDEIAITSGLDLETFPDNVWDRSLDGRNYAYWTRTNLVDIHKFKTSFNMPNDFNPTQYQATLRSSSFLSDIIPINDNIYVFVNGEEIYRGGSSYGASIDIELIPETDGWHVNGVTVNNLQSGENIIEIITEEWGGTWGGLGELELQLIASPITPTPTPTNTPTPIATPSAGDYAVSINAGSLFTKETIVTVSFTAPASTKYFKISNDGGFADAEWQPYAETIAWEIDQYFLFTLPRVVYARFKDANGSETSVYSDDIILDIQPPWGHGELQIVDSDSSKYKGELVIDADDDVSGIKNVRMSHDVTFTGSDWQPFKETIEIDLEHPNEPIFIQLSDRAGNISDPIEIDVSAQNVGLITDQNIYLPLIIRN